MSGLSLTFSQTPAQDQCLVQCFGATALIRTARAIDACGLRQLLEAYAAERQFQCSEDLLLITVFPAQVQACRAFYTKDGVSLGKLYSKQAVSKMDRAVAYQVWPLSRTLNKRKELTEG